MNFSPELLDQFRQLRMDLLAMAVREHIDLNDYARFTLASSGLDEELRAIEEIEVTAPPQESAA